MVIFERKAGHHTLWPMVKGLQKADIRAIVATIALHAFLLSLFIPNFSEVEMPAQQLLKISLLTPQSEISPAKTPKAELAVKQAENGAMQPKKILKTTNDVAPNLDSLEPASSADNKNKDNSKNAEAVVSTKPVYDAAYLNNPAPQYPKAAQRRKLSGTVMLDVIVAKDGSASNVSVVSSSGFDILDNSAKQAVSKWKFIPAKRDGVTVVAEVMVPIEFKME